MLAFLPLTLGSHVRLLTVRETKRLRNCDPQVHASPLSSSHRCVDLFTRMLTAVLCVFRSIALETITANCLAPYIATCTFIGCGLLVGYGTLTTPGIRLYALTGALGLLLDCFALSISGAVVILGYGLKPREESRQEDTLLLSNTTSRGAQQQSQYQACQYDGSNASSVNSG